MGLNKGCIGARLNRVLDKRYQKNRVPHVRKLLNRAPGDIADAIMPRLLLPAYRREHRSPPSNVYLRTISRKSALPSRPGPPT
jgi:hypothetical protein